MDSFDVIVVGGGAAGVPLAVRLSEDPGLRVLLLEAGPDARRRQDYPAELIAASMMSAAMPGHPNNWAFTARLTPELGCSMARGRILGGSTALNGAYFVRARKTDADRWAAAGNHEWSYEKILPYYIRLEKDLTYGDAPGHGSSGPMPVNRVTENLSPVTDAFYEAAEELGFSYEPDKNDMTSNEGYGPLPQNAVDGVRMNTALAYLSPVRESRPNLTVRGNTVVHRIILDGDRAIGVVARTGRRTTVFRAGTIVLCAGAIKSPHLLLLSGIGPADELRRAGIRVRHDLPGVGKGYTDHPDILFNWVPRRRLDDPWLPRLFEGVLHWTASGSATPGDLEILPMLRPFGRAVFGPAGKGLLTMAAHPLATLRGMMGTSLKRNLDQLLHSAGLNLVVALQRPESRGELTIVSPDPDVHPRLRHRYLTTARDRERMREALRVAAGLLRSKAFRPYVKRFGEIDRKTLDNDALLDAWARRHIGTAFHTAGTAKMGPAGDPEAVVDQYGRVHGIDGLWIADLSILPDVPSRGPAATAVMIGERVADFIREKA